MKEAKSDLSAALSEQPTENVVPVATPRTDALLAEAISPDHARYTMVTHARTLERELSTLSERLVAVEKERDEWIAADAKRVDWVKENMALLERAELAESRLSSLSAALTEIEQYPDGYVSESPMLRVAFEMANIARTALAALPQQQGNGDLSRASSGEGSAVVGTDTRHD